MFYLDVAYVCNCFQSFFRCFLSVLEVCFKFSIYLCMLQLLHSHVLKIDRIFAHDTMSSARGGAKGQAGAQTTCGFGWAQTPRQVGRGAGTGVGRGR